MELWGVWVVVGAVLVLAAVYVLKKHPINDITTDPKDPVLFLEPVEGLPYNPAFAKRQQRCYPEIKPLEFKLAGMLIRDVFSLLDTIVEQEGWTFVATTQGNEDEKEFKKIQAVATTPMFRFKDDVIIHAMEKGDGTGVIQMRSKSRVGKSDLGCNAHRITSFFHRLTQHPKWKAEQQNKKLE